LLFCGDEATRGDEDVGKRGGDGDSGEDEREDAAELEADEGDEEETVGEVDSDDARPTPNCCCWCALGPSRSRRSLRSLSILADVQLPAPAPLHDAALAPPRPPATTPGVVADCGLIWWTTVSRGGATEESEAGELPQSTEAMPPGPRRARAWLRVGVGPRCDIVLRCVSLSFFAV
jgi:hypothetical protein